MAFLAIIGPDCKLYPKGHTYQGKASLARRHAFIGYTGANLAPEIARREIARVYDDALRPARLDLERATREVLDAVNVVNPAASKVQVVRAQRAWLIGAGAIGFAAGLVAVPLLVHPLARLLPASWAVPQAISKSVLGR